ncbi:MAG: hypothetical protein VYD54_04110 [Bdellovibrionota bacterium]|nr:hypothetical protein [Bdellovibrionota bacterium]
MKKLYWVPLILLPVLLYFFLFKGKEKTQDKQAIALKNKKTEKKAQEKSAISSKIKSKLKKKGTFKNQKIVFKKPKMKGLKKKKPLFPKGRLKKFPWRKGRPVKGVKLKVPKKLSDKLKLKNEINPNWEDSFRNNLNKEANGKKVEVSNKNSIVVAQGDNAIYAEEVNVSIGEEGSKDQKKYTMIVDSGNGEVVHRVPQDDGGQAKKREPVSELADEELEQKWGEYVGFHYGQPDDLKQLETKKDDEKSLPSRISMTDEEKESYENSLKK